jgi:serine/threonine protein kinase
MGVVYRGHHAMLRRPTAIKLLDVEKTTDVSIARFEREVRLTSQLSHPNTISIYDFGRTPDGIFYYAMELLDGINLDTLVQDSGPLPESRVIYLLRQLCGSLNEAHGLGLIHRDVKPANIMVCRLGGMFDVAKLLDFGLVKAVDAQREAGLTAANALMGTPLYMSPEAIVGKTESIDARSDLYSLGGVGYFLLTGTTVFSGMSLAELFGKHTSAEPEPPSQRLGRPVDPLLESLIIRCLAKSPDDRPRSAEELAEGLARCESAGGWTAAAARIWWTERKSKVPADESGFAETRVGSLGDEGQCLSTIAP